MTKLAAILLFCAGCSIARIEEMPIEGDKAEVAFMAVRGKNRITGGYGVALRTEHGAGASRECDPDRPVLLGECEPGRCTAVITGRHFMRREISLDLKPGQRTLIVVNHRNVLNQERAETIATTSVKAVVITAGIVPYGIGRLAVECTARGRCARDSAPMEASFSCPSSCDASRPNHCPPAKTSGPKAPVRISSWKKP